ncbi:MAG: DUF692 family protein [Polyangia bacterium]
MSRPEARGGPLQAGVGMGWRPELAGGLMTAPQQVDWLEVVAEPCMAPGPTQREILALAEIWPVVPHGVKLSLGSADGIELERARRLGRLARALRSPCITEHVAFTRAGGREIGHLTQLPFTRAALAVLTRNVDAARRVLPDVPLLLENAAWTLRWPDDELAEGDFYHEVAARTGCRLLLDLGNVYANARNSGTDPLALLRSYPLDRIGMIHLAGGSLRGGFYIDTHADPVPAPVLELLAETLRCCGPLPILIERDACFPPFAETAAELHAARAVLQQAAAERPAIAQDTRMLAPLPDSPEERARLAQDQAALCAQLIAPQLAAPDPTPRFDPAAIRRSRDVLRWKRIDDALPLLEHLRRCVPSSRALAQRAGEALRGAPRLPRGNAPADALRIAARAASEPALARAAALDQLILRARFVEEDGGLRPRRAPFLGAARLAGARIWAWKGLGASAPVRLQAAPLNGSGAGEVPAPSLPQRS